MRLVLTAAALGTAALVLACGRDDPCDTHGMALPTVGPPAVVVSPPQLDLSVGEQDTVVSLAVALGDPRCGGIASPAVGWTVIDASVATATAVTSSRGVVLGLAPGTTSVTAALLARPSVNATVPVNVR